MSIIQKCVGVQPTNAYDYENMHTKKSLYKPNLPAKCTVPIKDYLVPYVCVEKKNTCVAFT